MGDHHSTLPQQEEQLATTEPKPELPSPATEQHEQHAPTTTDATPEGETEESDLIPNNDTDPIPGDSTARPQEDDNRDEVGDHDIDGHRDSSSSAGARSHFSVDLSIDTSDADTSDADSALGDIGHPSSSVSVTSSIYKFVEEYGRTYHAYKEGKYPLPNDIPEQERLDLQHSIAVRLFGGLAVAPLKNPKRVLDIGTGTGIWAIEFATEHPESEVIGTDLSPIQPDYVPPNCQFLIDDAEDEWLFSSPFDYVHSRFMVSAFSNFPRVFQSAYDNMAPGGVIEFQEYSARLQAVDDTLKGTAIELWSNRVLEAVSRAGKDGLCCHKFKQQMLDVGFVDVVEKRFALPGNAWARGAEEKMLGTMQLENMMEGIQGMSMNLFNKVLGMSREEVELFLMDVRKDMRNRHIHFYYVLYSVYGRKPL
ncbi:S-adenosyl-L-methionine-dependent methyltransferase [Podospora didyma]|uniref:S-adenosyl-L-methionine-dependent methyltransferase n=1 Tax=Podospora didyma TaxID=330526 RepID=A0AAE0K1K1_9PEZI|nr:S-adenosyl-L-methionine-dependent methyltransferase [Podospora didyma]